MNNSRNSMGAANPSKASSVKNLSSTFGIAKQIKPAAKPVDNSIRNAKGQPTGKMSSGAGWGGEPPVGGASYQSKK